jgi:hypothetical protein
MAWKNELHAMTREELLRVRDEDYKRVKKSGKKQTNLPMKRPESGFKIG